MIQFRYFKSAEAEQFTFYRIPKALFTSDIFKPLSCEAKVLYGLMLDRVSLSVKNGWMDEESRVYIIYSVPDICDQLGCARQKAFKLLAELDSESGIGLIERVRRGQGKENLIYVRNFILEKEAPTVPDGLKMSDTEGNGSNAQKYENHTSGSMTPENEAPDACRDEICDVQKYENHTSRSMKDDFGITEAQKYENHTSRSTEIILPEVRKSYSSNTNNNKTNRSDTEILSIHPISPSILSVAEEGDGDMMGCDSQTYYDSVIEDIREQVGYEALSAYGYDKDQAGEIITIMADIETSRKKSMMVGGERVPMWKLKKRLREIDMLLMQYVLDSLSKNRSDVKNVRKYMIAALYNAPTTVNTYYQQAVNHDQAIFYSEKEGGG